MLGTITITVGQRGPEDVREKDSDKEMATNCTATEDIKDGQEEIPEILEQIPSSASNLEETAQPSESQTSDVGFKKVFKFVGFKFTVKKDKNEKSDTVQLLTVKKEEGEGAGAGDHQEPSMETEETATKELELKQSTETSEDTLMHEQSNTEIYPRAESAQAAEEGKDEGEERPEKELAKSPESATSPVTTETASPFKKFFTHGWAGWRKKTSFRKPKEDELEASEKKKEQETEKVDLEENEKTEEICEPPIASEQPQEPAEGVDQARLSADYEKVELPLEDPASGLQGSAEEKCAPLATEVFDEKIEVHQEVVAEVHISTTEKETEGQEADVEGTVESLSPEKLVEANVEPQEAKPAEEVKLKELCISGGDHLQPTDLSPDEKVLSKHPEGIVSEVDLLSSQERIKVQGSPLKKLFSSTGLKKLSGKRQKGKRGDEEPGEQHPVPLESPDSGDEQKGESSASSPDEPEEITGLEKGVAEGQQEGEVEEGAISDGEKKREGITPWASFKKMVTPKKRVRRPSESDKEDELDKIKSATLSSTESTASEMQEEIKGVGEEQKPEEPKRKVDTSVSWEALICVGSSKKRARKASSSDEEGGPKSMGGDAHRAEEAARDKEPGADVVLASSQEQDQAQGSSSPEAAGSPSEGEGASPWESFKRLVTPRKKPKSKPEEKTEDLGIEHSASDIEPGKEDAWVSIKKFIPGRRKKRSDGKQEQAALEDAGPTEVNEDDSDVPAVVPLSEYDAVEREKTEAQKAQKSAEKPEEQVMGFVSEEISKTLVHTVTVAVIDGTRAVTIVEERSPSWISASVTEPLEPVDDETVPLAKEVIERDIVAEETPVVSQTVPESREVHKVTILSEAELTSEAVTAAETTEAIGTEEATEASGAEETTEMVSAVSQLTDSPDTTEEATPVQEVEGGVPDLEDLERQTQAVLQAVAEKVKEESEWPDTLKQEAAIQTTREAELKASEKVEDVEEGEAPGPREEREVKLEVHIQEANTERFTQGAVMVQPTLESLEEVPEVTACTESGEPVIPSQAEKPQESEVGQAVPPDSAETPTDSETNGSTPVADLEALDTIQDDEVMKSHEENTFAPGTQPQATEAETVPAHKEASASFQSQEENKEQSRTEDVLEYTEQEQTAEEVLVSTEVVQEVRQSVNEEMKDEPRVEGHESSTSTDRTDRQEEVTEIALDGEVECEKDDNIEPQRPSPEEEETETQAEREKNETKPTPAGQELELKTAAPICEELSPQLIQIVDRPVSDRGREVSSLEHQEDSGCIEVQVQSSDASVTLTAAVEEEHLAETGETLESAGAHSTPVVKFSEKDEDWTPQPGDDTVPEGPESWAESVTVTASATHEKGHCDLEGERGAFQEQGPDEGDQQVGCQEGNVTDVKEGDLEADNEILGLETESSKLVQNIIQTAVDQFGQTEAAASETPDLQTQASPEQSNSQGAGQKTEDDRQQAPAQDETQAIATQDEFVLTTVGPAPSDIPEDSSEASENMVMVEVESSSVNGPQCEEVIPPSDTDGDGTKAKLVPDDGQAELGERVEKPSFESKEKETGEATLHPGNQFSALSDTDACGGGTKESSGANGLKGTQEEDSQEGGLQEGEGHSEPEKEMKPQKEEEELENRESEPPKPKLTEH
uniref:A-kinase anchor protein 12 n=1 Tax=Castor canadensis TaxID=51338 RepID=A0A250Y7W6_CASCN